MSAVNTDTDTILEVLNDKMDRDGNNLNQSAIDFDVVVEWQTPTAANNYTWYRKYASGWVEQGGILIGITSSYTTKTLLVTMSDTNYTFICSTADEFSGTQYAIGNPISASTYQIKYSGTGTAKCSWEVKGMAATA